MRKKNKIIGPLKKEFGKEYRKESDTVLSVIESRPWASYGAEEMTSGVASVARYFNFAARVMTEVRADSSYQVYGDAPGTADVKSEVTTRSFDEMDKDFFARETLARAKQIFSAMGGVL